MSGQGPYFGQAVWFYRCPDDIPIGKQRYLEQTVRVFEVLDNILKGKDYLTGNKYTYADLSFVLWNRVALLAPFFSSILWDKYNIK
ncbi:hypothetical protein BKA56DRAFT_673095 [Ilyonectria sp. MPI-CAGE-AT-0026]|nr:hypothetical protein BKA56DRAFT_673095 [Ilyonectria sp. MPI-CAGE-AT-0026]